MNTTAMFVHLHEPENSESQAEAELVYPQTG